MGTIITKVFDFNLPNLNWARTKLDPASIGQAVTALQNARRIEFFGFGASGIVVLDAQQTFPLFGVPCGAPIDGHQMFITAAMLGPGDVVVAISNTGQTREVNQAARTARKKGTGVIAIMGADGPLSGEADIRILVDRLENADLYTPSVSRLGHLVINDMLAVAVSLAKDETHQRRIAETKERLATTRSSGVC